MCYASYRFQYLRNIDVRSTKQDLITWLTGLKDEKVISMLKAIKDHKGDEIDILIQNTPSLQKLLGNRLQEDPATLSDAKTSLEKIREALGL